MAKEPGRVKKRERKNITSGVAHVNASFNNTMVTITTIRDVTPIPHNGCRPPKRRRVEGLAFRIPQRRPAFRGRRSCV